ncbi:MAG: rod shape-determining protein MreD [Tumebacillaceae bacterium]
MNPILMMLTMMGMLVIQSTLFQVQPFSFVAPNICLVMLLFISLMRGSMLALYIGLIIGLIQDVLFGTFIGLHGFTFAVVGYFAGMTFRSYWTRSFVMVLLIILGFTLLHEITEYSLSQLFGHGHVDLMAAVTHALRMMIWNGILSLLLYSPSVRLLGRERRGLADDAL